MSGVKFRANALLIVLASVLLAGGCGGRAAKAISVLNRIVSSFGPEEASAARAVLSEIGSGDLNAAGVAAWKHASRFRAKNTPNALRAADLFEEAGEALGVPRPVTILDPVPSPPHRTPSLPPDWVDALSIPADLGWPVAKVEADVRSFARAFERGWRDAERVLDEMTGPYARLAREWRDVPPEKRRMIIGSSEDEQAIADVTAHWRREGFATFFFPDCLAVGPDLCSSEEVGAFAATAGGVIVVDTPAGQASRYVRREIETYRALATGKRRAIYITPNEIRLGASAGIGVATGTVISLDRD